MRAWGKLSILFLISVLSSPASASVLNLALDTESVSASGAEEVGENSLRVKLRFTVQFSGGAVNYLGLLTVADNEYLAIGQHEPGVAGVMMITHKKEEATIVLADRTRPETIRINGAAFELSYDPPTRAVRVTKPRFQ